MDNSSESPATTLNSNNGGEPKMEEHKPKQVVIMGPTGSGKSRLAIDLATHFPIEIINADSMQVYQGLDVLTNKVPLYEQNGVPHHLLGTVSSDVEFTANKFRDSAIPIISDILSRNHLPVIVGGTNFYIQAVVSSFLLDESVEDMSETYSRDHPGNEQTNHMPDILADSCNYSYDLLKELDPVAADRIHPNNHRKINLYLSLYARSGVLPSKLYQGKAAETEQTNHMPDILGDSCNYNYDLLKELDPVAANRIHPNNHRKKRRVNQLQTLFGWNISYVDATEYISKKSDECWAVQVVGPAVKMIRSFLNKDDSNGRTLDGESKTSTDTVQRDLWTQYVCKQNWGRVDNSSYRCCFICIDAALPVLDQYVEHRVDCMIDAGLLDEVYDIYNRNANYTLGLRQAIGVREFENFLQAYFSDRMDDEMSDSSDETLLKLSTRIDDKLFKENIRGILISSCDNPQKVMLEEAIDKVKANTRRLVRRQACGDRILRGAHEWEQHKQGRGHRKRMLSLRKSQSSSPA
ncbi:hypothetical protein GOBAR_AA11877 [Gossypium barbadense]|uniref:tRNA dimethylallyltransferase 2 n=1 Tax=Gossypium barbadense TaxID=3634 RepID=A0A2P5XZL2_GOSBA|nr:hypothetical protein GOBAR_AA11877 [Gossypium barbadense]